VYTVSGNRQTCDEIFVLCFKNTDCYLDKKIKGNLAIWPRQMLGEDKNVHTVVETVKTEGKNH